MSSLYKDTLDREGGMDVLRGSQSNASESNLKKIVEVHHKNGEANKRYGNLNTCPSEDKLSMLHQSHISQTAISSRKFEITDNYSVAKKIKEFENRAIKTAVQNQFRKKSSIEQST